MGHVGVGWVMQGLGGVVWVMQGWGGSCRDGVGHAGVGWGGSCKGGMGLVMQGWGECVVQGFGWGGWVSHTRGVRRGGSCKGGVGWVMQGWGGVGHVRVGWVIQGWGRVGHSVGVELIFFQFTFNLLQMTQEIITCRVSKIHKWIQGMCMSGGKFLKE